MISNSVVGVAALAKTPVNSPDFYPSSSLPGLKLNSPV